MVISRPVQDFEIAERFGFIAGFGFVTWFRGLFISGSPPDRFFPKTSPSSQGLLKRLEEGFLLSVILSVAYFTSFDLTFFLVPYDKDLRKRVQATLAHAMHYSVTEEALEQPSRNQG